MRIDPIIISFVSVVAQAEVTDLLGFDQNCNNVQQNYYNIQHGLPASPILSVTALTTRFSLVQQFTSGKGGAKVYWVKDKNNQNEDKVLKIFPEENFQKDFNHNNEQRETWFSCELSKLNFKEKGFEFLSADKSFFPAFYGFGYTLTDVPFADARVTPNKKHLFMLMEFIKGKDMYEHSEDKSSAESPYRNASTSRAILYQVLAALNQAYEKMGFFHKDLHPGNIILSEDKLVSLKIDDVMVQAPMIKIIDFGLATSKEFYASDKINNADAQALKLSPSRNYSLVLLKFISNFRSLLTGPLVISKAGSLAKQYPAGDDIQFINMIIYSFRNYYSSFSDYCRDYKSCKEAIKIN